MVNSTVGACVRCCSMATTDQVLETVQECPESENEDVEADNKVHKRVRLESEWERVFSKLDKADGRSDGRVDRRAIVKWVSAMDLQKRIEFESNLEITPRELERLVSRADADKDGFVDRQEFLNLVCDDEKLSGHQQGLLRQYLQVLAYADHYSWCPPPFVIPVVTVLQVAVYIYHLVHFAQYHEDANIGWSGPEPVCSKLVYNPTRRREAWRFVSYCLVHAGVQHILFNMLMQLFVGLPLEASHGYLRIATVYFAGVLAGSLGSSTIDPGAFLAGASGGVYALIAAHLSTLILNWQEDIVIMRDRFRSGRSPAAKHGHIVRTMRLVIVVLYCALDTGTAIWHRRRAKIQGRPPSVNTSYAAHVAGLIAGLLVGIVVLKNRKVERWERTLKFVCLFLTLTAFALAVLWHCVGDIVVQLVTKDVDATYFPNEESEWLGKLCHDWI